MTEISSDSFENTNLYVTDLDKELDQMYGSYSKEMDVDALHCLVNSIAAVNLQKQKGITSEMAFRAKDMQKENLDDQISAQRDWKPLALSTVVGGIYLSSVGTMVQAKGMDPVALQVTQQMFSSAASGMQQGQGISQNFQTVRIQTASSKMEAARQDKVDLDQAKSSDGSHLDGQRQKEDARQRALFDLKRELIRQ